MVVEKGKRGLVAGQKRWEDRVLRDAATPPTSQWHTCNDISALVAYLHSWTAHTSDLSAVLGGVKWAPVAA